MKLAFQFDHFAQFGLGELSWSYLKHHISSLFLRTVFSTFNHQTNDEIKAQVPFYTQISVLVVLVSRRHRDDDDDDDDVVVADDRRRLRFLFLLDDAIRRVEAMLQ